MKLGIDLGTTRIVVAAVDRGNYPLVAFEAPDGASRDWFPPMIADGAGGLLFGWRAWLAQADPATTVVRSIKRYLGDARPDTPVRIGGRTASMLELLAAMAAELKRVLIEESSLRLKSKETLEAVLGVPANANGNQRFLTVEAFRLGGFLVPSLLNEPAAASVEYGHGARRKDARADGRLLVHDFGGGTFDVSLVEVQGSTHTVVASAGISTLGGDDFDAILAELALDRAGMPAAERDTLSQAEWHRLMEECRVKKEALHPNTRRVVIDLGAVRDAWEAVTVPASEYLERCRPLVVETIHAAEDLLAANPGDVEAIYAAGGGSEFPLVTRALRETFGRQVKRSPYSRSATAIGLAIQADAAAGYQLRDKFTRHFGVWREAEGGRHIVFDPLFGKGTPMPGPGEEPLPMLRHYAPAHNIGHFRYLECSQLAEDGRPAGDITLWDDILFPFDPELRDREELAGIPVQRSGEATGQWVEEAYQCDARGTVTVTISNHTTGYQRAFRLGRWAQKSPVTPGRRKAERAVRKAGAG